MAASRIVYSVLLLTLGSTAFGILEDSSEETSGEVDIRDLEISGQQMDSQVQDILKEHGKAEKEIAKKYRTLHSKGRDLVTPDPTEVKVTELHDKVKVTRELNPRLSTNIVPQSVAGGSGGVTTKHYTTRSVKESYSTLTGNTADDEYESTAPGAGATTFDAGATTFDAGSTELEPEEDLMHLVLKLRAQVKASQDSQVRTRSILVVLEETQERQDRDLAILKNDLVQLRQEVEADRQVTNALKELVGDNAWASNNLKNEQNQLRGDFEAVKAIQEEQNETHIDLEEAGEKAAKELQNHHNAINTLRYEMTHMRNTISHHRKQLSAIAAALNIRLNKGKLPRRMNKESQEENQLPIYESSADDLVSVEVTDTPVEVTSGHLSPSYLEEIMSTLEEQKNVVEHNMAEFAKNEDERKKEMGGFSQRFQMLESEVSKLYAMVFNLSLQHTSLDNKISLQKQQMLDTELKELQESFMNFTQQMFTLEQMYYSGVSVNSTYLPENMVQEAIGRIEQQQEDFNRTCEEKYNTVLSYIQQVNQSSVEFQSTFSVHNSRAKNIFEDVHEKFVDLEKKVENNNNRLAHVEVKVLNATLQQCEKNNMDHVQDKKLSEFNSKVSKLDDSFSQHNSQLSRLDRGLSRLYKEVDEQKDVVKGMLGQMEGIMSLALNVATLQQEVNKLVHDLPQDCQDIQSMLVDPKDGVYLIRPAKSPHSIRTYCQFTADTNDTDIAWTVIQRRMDGSVSFARNWDEYKEGFGEAEGEFWLGNDNLYYLTSQKQYQLHIDMWDLQDKYWWARYNIFLIDTEGVNYRLHVDSYHGNSTDALGYSNNMPFSTIDKDNDVSSTHCAKFYTSGWWYKHCQYSNLNGRYTVGVVWFNHDTDEWIQMKKTVMKVRPMNIHRDNMTN